MTAVVGVLLAACGCDGRSQEPGIEALGETVRERLQEPDTEALDGSDGVSDAAVAELEGEIDRLERECIPAKGVSRGDVEARFGEGAPSVISKIPTLAPADSPYRRYEFCEGGVLGVRYDADWRVGWAHFDDPYSLKGVPIGRTVPLEQRAHELRRRLAQMRRIREEYRRRFGE